MQQAVSETAQDDFPEMDDYEKEQAVADRQKEMESLDALGRSLSKTRTEAIAHRLSSGIEEIWREDEEFYEGIDDLNRGDERMLRSKPSATGSSGPGRLKTTRSRVFPNITAPYVDTAAAHMSDTSLPNNEKPWKYDPTPIPELTELAEQHAAENPKQAQETAKKGMLGKIKQAFSSSNPEETEVRNDLMVDQDDSKTPEQAYQELQEARAKAEATETRVWDWHVENQWNAEVRKQLHSSAKCGVGILKGPFPKISNDVRWIPETIEIIDGQEVQIPGRMDVSKSITPASKCIDKWNFYPDGGCGNNIQNGNYIWERDFISEKQLRELMGSEDSGYLDEQIKLCLKEGPTRALATIEDGRSVSTDMQKDGMYEIWYMSGTAKKEDLEIAGCDCEGNEDIYIEAQLTLVNERVIKAALPALDLGGYIYDVHCWRKREGFWAGIGVARDIRVAQKIVVGGSREMMNNAGLAGGPMIVMKQSVIRPADGIAAIGPRKLWYIHKDDQLIADATKAIGSIKVDMLVNEFMVIINLGLKLAEDTSGFPLMMQGQMGSTPDRVGVVNALTANTSIVKQRVALILTDDVIVPQLRRYHIWHLQYGPDNEKGDIKINVKGYRSLIERDAKNQMLGQLLTLALDPRFGLDPIKVGKDYLKSLHFVYEDLAVDDEQWQALLQNWQQMIEASANDPRVQVAQINAESRQIVASMDNEFSGAMQLSAQEHKAQEAELNRQDALIKTTITKELAQLKEQGVSQNTLNKIKADLSKKVMEIKSTERLVGMKAPANALPPPPVEPPGRATPGHSYTQ